MMRNHVTIALMTGFLFLAYAVYLLPTQPSWSVIVALVGFLMCAFVWLNLVVVPVVPKVRQIEVNLIRPSSALPESKVPVVPVVPVVAVPVTTPAILDEAFETLMALGCKRGEAGRLIKSVASTQFNDVPSLIAAVYRRT